MGKKKKTKKPQPHKVVQQAELKTTPASLESVDLPLQVDSAVAEKASEDSLKIPVAAKEIVVDPAERRAKIAASIKPVSSVADKLNQQMSSQSRMRRMLPDITRVLLAFTVIAVGTAIWLQPPLFNTSFPITTFRYKGKAAQAAVLYRPLAMQERYYVELPEKLEDRYQWFAIDRRREEVALCEEPPHRLFGHRAIRRGAKLGLDLEFRDIDGSEWLIYFYTDAIVFSNNVLAVRLDIKEREGQ